MATGTDTTQTALDFGNDLDAMTRRITGVSLAIGCLHHGFSEELLDGVEQLVMDLQREAQRVEQAYDAILKAQGVI